MPVAQVGGFSIYCKSPPFRLLLAAPLPNLLMETALCVVAPTTSLSYLAAAAMPTPTMRAASKILTTCHAAALMPKLTSIAIANPWQVSNSKWEVIAKMNTAGATLAKMNAAGVAVAKMNAAGAAVGQNVALAHRLNAAGASVGQNIALGRELAASGAGLPAGIILHREAIFTGSSVGHATAAAKVLPAVGPGFDVSAWGLQPRRAPVATPTLPADAMLAAPAVAAVTAELLSPQDVQSFQASPPAAVATAEPTTRYPAAPLLGLAPANGSAPALHLRDALSGGELADLLAAVVGLSGAPAALHHSLGTGLPAQPLTRESRFALLDRLLAANGYAQHQRHEIALCLADAAGPAGGPWVGWGGPVATDAPPAATGPAPVLPAPMAAGLWAAVLTNGFALAELDRLLVFVGLLESIDTKAVAPETKPAQWVAVREALQETKCISANNRSWARAIITSYGERVGKQRALENPRNHSNDAANHCYQRAKLWLTGRQKSQ